jgi:S1-C subfamily serine protease
MTLDELSQVSPVAAQAARCVVSLRGQAADGDGKREVLLSGTLVGPDSLVVSAPRAVVDGLTHLRAQLADGREVNCARVSGASGPLAVLRLTLNGQPVKDLPYLTTLTTLPPPGTPLVVLGNPYGLARSVTVTLVGGPRRKLAAAPGAELQLDGPLAAGNSGGPVVDLQGRLVGIAYGTVEASEPGPVVSLAVPGDVIAACIAPHAAK